MVSLSKRPFVLNRAASETARNFGPVMATAAPITIAQVQEIVGLGDLDPEAVVTPGIVVDVVVAVPNAARPARTVRDIA